MASAVGLISGAICVGGFGVGVGAVRARHLGGEGHWLIPTGTKGFGDCIDMFEGLFGHSFQ